MAGKQGGGAEQVDWQLRVKSEHREKQVHWQYMSLAIIYMQTSLLSLALICMNLVFVTQ